MLYECQGFGLLGLCRVQDVKAWLPDCGDLGYRLSRGLVLCEFSEGLSGACHGSLTQNCSKASPLTVDVSTLA